MEEYNPKNRLIVHKIAIVLQIFVLIYSFVSFLSNGSEEEKKKIANAEAKTGTNKFGFTNIPQQHQVKINTKPEPHKVIEMPKLDPWLNTSKNSDSENKFTDPRDSKKYKTAKIGNQIWMAENLNYNANGSKCYENKESNCKKYGRMYNWATAMKACPSGWHLPSEEEWDDLITETGGNETAGRYLKATSGWNDFNDESGNGLDTYNFAALPGGSQSNNTSHLLGANGYWWSASENEEDNTAYYLFMLSENDEVGRNNKTKSLLLNVRCLQD